MKVKDEKETCGPMTGEHRYLKEHKGSIEKGHQNTPIGSVDYAEKRMKKMGRIAKKAQSRYG